MANFHRYTFFRWAIPITTTIFLLILVIHKSPDPILFSRYNYHFFTLLASMAVLASACWWISLNEVHYHRLLNRIARLPLISLTIILIGLLTFVDMLVDLIVAFAFLPLVILLILIILVIPTKFNKIGDDVNLQKFNDALQVSAIVVISVFIGLIPVEFVFRSLILEPKVPASQEEFSRLISSSWPQTISINKPAGTFRILGLSDSFGRMGGNTNYHYVLENLLTEAGYNIEIVNISAVDYGPFDELEVLKRFGTRYNPDLILHGFYVGNDLGVPDSNVMTYLGIGVRIPQGFVAYRPRNFLSIQWLRYFITVQIDKIRQEMERKTTTSKTQGVFSETGFLNIERRYLKNFQINPPPNRRWIGTVNTLDDLRKEAAQIDATYVLIIHPDQIQIAPELQHDLEQTFGLSLELGYDFELPQQFLTEYCLSRDVYCLDLLPTFNEYQAEELYQFRDIHYNETGNRLAADIILEFLQERQLLLPH